MCTTRCSQIKTDLTRKTSDLQSTYRPNSELSSPDNCLLSRKVMFSW
uniref:Uncharacterized protein n=1 Tax=Arundo donax TaxID=35708 RepID=A0A0A9FX70_ARUDO